MTRAGSPPLGTSIVTEFGDCVSQQQDSYRLIICDIDKRTFVLDTGFRTDHMAQHTERHIALLRSARQYTVELTVYVFCARGGDRAQTMASLNTDLLGSNWKGAS